VSQILQNVFVEQETIKASSSGTDYYLNRAQIIDVPGMLGPSSQTRGEQVVRLRGLLDTMTRYDYDANLWNEKAGPTQRTLGIFYDPVFPTVDGNTTFMSPLPYNFSTGIIEHQYAPRISSNTSYYNISEDEFTKSCRNETENGGFYVKYGNSGSNESYSFYNFDVKACMPGDKRTSPWKPTRDRQDIIEDLFLNYTRRGSSALFKVQVNTTLGMYYYPDLVE
jgi:hypothetical protein